MTRIFTSFALSALLFVLIAPPAYATAFSNGQRVQVAYASSVNIVSNPNSPGSVIGQALKDHQGHSA